MDAPRLVVTTGIRGHDSSAEIVPAWIDLVFCLANIDEYLLTM